MKIHTIDIDFQGIPKSIAVFLIETTAGLVLVECGPHSTFPALESAIQAKGFKTVDISHVFLSHIHFDHAGAAWAFAEKGATIHVHPKGAPHLAAPEKLYNSAKMIYADAMETLWGIMQSIAENRLYVPENQEITEAIGLQFQAHFTPGHAVHHIAWQVSEKGKKSVLFTGDVAGVKIGCGPVMPPCPPPDINVEHWLQSIELMESLPVSEFYLTHFGKIKETKQHLAALKTELLAWAEWMKPHFENQKPQSEIVPLFNDFVKNRLKNQGVGAKGLKKYEAANPAFMSVAGLMRYWAKRNLV